jgi:hypothetical protein
MAMSDKEGRISRFLASLFAAADAVRECEDFEECLVHFGLAIPEGWRSAHRAFAERYGLWWRACPLCGEHFGSHEHDDGDPAQHVPFPEDAIAADPILASCRQRICRACSRPGKIERLTDLAARGTMTGDEAVRWAVRIYPGNDEGTEHITREALERARLAVGDR